MKRYQRIFIAVGTATCIIAVGHVFGVGTGCYIQENVPCNNVPQKELTCQVNTGSGVNQVKKKVNFVVTEECSVQGYSEIQPSSSKSGLSQLEQSQARECWAKGYYPDCDGKATTPEVIKATCNTQLPKSGSPQC